MGFYISGVTYGNHQAPIAQLAPGQAVRLHKEIDNPADIMAIAVSTFQGQKLGYVPALLNHHYQEGVYEGSVVQLPPCRSLGAMPGYKDVIIFVPNQQVQMIPLGLGNFQDLIIQD